MQPLLSSLAERYLASWMSQGGDPVLIVRVTGLTWLQRNLAALNLAEPEECAIVARRKLRCRTVAELERRILAELKLSTGTGSIYAVTYVGGVKRRTPLAASPDVEAMVASVAVFEVYTS